MKVGLLARADNRGLGLQTWEAYRHLQPTSTIVVDMSANTPYKQHFDRYPGCPVAEPDQLLGAAKRAGWFDGAVDVIFTAETPYDYRLYDTARTAGVATVCQVNPEFYRHGREPDLPAPTMAVTPTPWLSDRMPGVAVLPFPVDRDRCTFRRRPTDPDRVTFLHVAGHRAAYDRNGTSTLLQALARTTVPMRVLVRSQSDLDLGDRTGIDHLDVDLIVDDVPDYWRLYDDGDVLVLPRRYGGQSLPMNEAMSCGLPVIATDLIPQREWLPPATLISTVRRRRFRTQAGLVDAWHGDPTALARTMDRLAADHELVATLSDTADRQADRISWDTLRPRYDDLFEQAVHWQRRGR